MEIAIDFTKLTAGKYWYYFLAFFVLFTVVLYHRL